MPKKRRVIESSSSEEEEEDFGEDYGADESEEAPPGYYYCIACKRDMHEDNFSASKLKGPPDERYCLRHTSTSGFGRSFLAPPKPVNLRFAVSSSEDEGNLPGFVESDSDSEADEEGEDDDDDDDEQFQDSEEDLLSVGIIVPTERRTMRGSLKIK